MIIKLKLLSLLLAFSSLLQASDKQEVFKQVIDYCNCKITSTYCKQYADMRPDSKEKVAYNSIKDNLNCSIGSTKSYSEVCLILNKNRFATISQACLSVFDRISKIDVTKFSNDDIVTKIIDEIFNSPELKSIITQYSEVNSLKTPLTKDITDYLTQSFASRVSPNTTDDIRKNEVQNEFSRLQELIDLSNSKQFKINLLSLFLIIVFSSAVFILLKLKLSKLESNIYKRLEELNSLEQKKAGNPSVTQSPLLNNPELKSFVEDKISEQNDSISKLQRELDAILSKTTNKEETQQVHHPTISQIERHHKPEYFFASIPDRDGSFSENAITNTLNPTASYYRFTVGKDADVATFEFINDERAVKDAVSSPELILYPVCKIKNSQNQNAKRIKTPSHGTVIKRNNRWELGTKAEIEYE